MPRSGDAWPPRPEWPPGCAASRSTCSGNSATLRHLLEDAQGRYGITSLKREPRDFGWREMTRELGRGQELRPLYDIASRVLPLLQISHESITYYASLA